MPEKNMLRNIRPFNDYMFRSCYYHHLITAYRHFGIHENVLLKNYLPYYGFDGTALAVSYEHIHTENELEALTGIKVKEDNIPSDPVSGIISRIDKNRPVILAVDCFSLPHRQDTFNKEHIIHHLLVYGYDKEKREFIISEHLHRNSILYERMEIGFDALSAVVRDYEEKLKKSGSGGFVTFRRVGKTRNPQAPDYLTGYYEQPEILEKSLSSLEAFCAFLKTVFNKNTKNETLEKIAEGIHKARTMRNSQRILFEDIGGCDEALEIIDRISDDFLFISGAVTKVIIKPFVDEKVVSKAVMRIDELYSLETRLHEFLSKGKCV